MNGAIATWLIFGLSVQLSNGEHQSQEAIKYASTKLCLAQLTQVLERHPNRRFLVKPRCSQTRPSFWIERVTQ